MTGKPIRSAGFTVLKAPDVPSVLIELGFLSNPKDEERLKSAAWRKSVAKALAAASSTASSRTASSRQSLTRERATPLPHSGPSRAKQISAFAKAELCYLQQQM